MANITVTLYWDMDLRKWTTTLGGTTETDPIQGLVQGDIVKFAVRFVQNDLAVVLAAPVFTASGIKADNDFTGSYLIQLSAPVLSDTTLYTFTVNPLNSANLNTFLQTYRNTWCALEIYDSVNGILTTPLELQIMPGYSLSGTPTDNVAGVIVVAAGKTVTFPQSLTFPSALGTNDFQLTTDGAGALTWAAGTNAPGGSTTQVQYNNAGSFAGITGATTNGTALTLVAPVLGDATATSLNGITIQGDSGAAGIYMSSGAGGIDLSNIGGSITTNLVGGNINTQSNGGNIDTSNGGGSISTSGTGSIELGVTGTRTTFTGAASGTNKSIALPNATGTLVLEDNTATLTNKDIVATQLSGNVAVARIATALTTPGAIGGTTASTGAFTTVTLPVNSVDYVPTLNLGGGRGMQASTNYVSVVTGSGYIIAFNSGDTVVNCNLAANPNNSRTCGTTGARWSNVFSVLGNFSGAVTAESATLTGNAGLSGTFATVPATLPTYANDESFRILMTPPTANVFGNNARVMDIVAGSGSVGSFMRFMLGEASAAATTKMVLSNTGGLQLGGGDAIPNANAVLDLQGTTKAFMPPRVTTTQKTNIASPTAGMVVYDSTLNKLGVYTGAAWETGVLEAGVKQTVSVMGTNLAYYGTGNRSTAGNILATQPAANCASGSDHRLVFTVCPNYWAGKSVKIKMIFTNTNTGNQQTPRLGCAIRNTALDGADTDQYNLGSNDSTVFDTTYSATGPTVSGALMVAESNAFTISSSATAITIQVGFEAVSAGTAQIAEAQLIEQ